MKTSDMETAPDFEALRAKRNRCVMEQYKELADELGEDYFVVDTTTGLWLSSGSDEAIEEMA